MIGRYLKRDVRGIVFKLEELFSAPGEFQEFAATCHSLSIGTTQVAAWAKFAWWVDGEYGCTISDHNLVVNDHSCANGFGSSGAWTAGSAHAGDGANTVFLDGHVMFIRSSVDLMTWRALGTHAAEVLSLTH